MVSPNQFARCLAFIQIRFSIQYEYAKKHLLPKRAGGVSIRNLLLLKTKFILLDMSKNILSQDDAGTVYLS